MRKYLKAILFLAAAVTLMSVTALAADAGGIYNVTVEDAYQETVKVTPLLPADDSPISPGASADGKITSGYYAGAVRVKVEYTGTTEKTAYYLILAQNAEGTPTAENIVYIDQATGSATFTVYPSSLTTGTYYIYLSSTGSAKTQIASFKYYQPYTLGDVNGKGGIDVSDAALVMNHIVKNIVLSGNQFLAADVAAPKGTVDVSDAAKLLNYIVKNITSLD